MDPHQQQFSSLCTDDDDDDDGDGDDDDGGGGARWSWGAVLQAAAEVDIREGGAFEAS